MMKSLLTELTQNPGNPSISIVVSTELTSFAEKEKIRLKLKNHANQAVKKLESNYDEAIAKKLKRSIMSLIETVDFGHLESGVGIFVSPGLQKLVSFPFPVKDQTTVGNEFETSAIRENLDKMIEYSVVILSRDKTRLIHGIGTRLTEVEDANFPQPFENEFQVHRASPYSFYNSEESEVDEARMKTYFRKIDNLLEPYIKDKPMVILGVINSLMVFKSVSKHSQSIVVEVKGSFDKSKPHEISKWVWPEMEKYSERVS